MVEAGRAIAVGAHEREEVKEKPVDRLPCGLCVGVETSVRYERHGTRYRFWRPKASGNLHGRGSKAI